MTVTLVLRAVEVVDRRVRDLYGFAVGRPVVRGGFTASGVGSVDKVTELKHRGRWWRSLQRPVSRSGRASTPRVYGLYGTARLLSQMVRPW
jgi:hypothetical protein